MAGTVVWKGDSAPIAQVTTCTVGGTVEADDLFIITIGSKSLSVVAGSTAVATVATNIMTAFNALNQTLWPEFSGAITAAATSGGALTLTAKTAGVPFTVTLTTTEANGGAADAQTFGQTATTAATGGAFFNLAKNWDTGVVPAAGDDVVFQNSANPCLYGLDNNAVTLLSLTIDQSFTGQIGLPRVNVAGYTEYRDTYLKISATTITIGKGEGAGSGRIKVNVGSVQTAVTVLNSGTPIETGVKSVQLVGTHASNSLVVDKGSVGVAAFAGETSTLLTLREGFKTSVNSDADVALGSGVTLSSATITKTGGQLNIQSNFVTLNQYGGETGIEGSATKTTMLILGGKVIDKSSGTATTVTVGSGGEVDNGQSMKTKTYTNTNVRKGGVLRDPAKGVTFTNAIALTCALADCTLDLGNTFNFQRS